MEIKLQVAFSRSVCFWGAQAASLLHSATGRMYLANANAGNDAKAVRGKLPRTTGWQPVLLRPDCLIAREEMGCNELRD